MDVEDSPQPLSLLTATTMTTVLPLLCNNIYTCLDQVEWVVGRLKAELAVVTLPAASGSSPRSR